LLLSERISIEIFLFGSSAVDLPYPVIEYSIFGNFYKGTIF
jgi:hypothetical protein